MSTLEADNTITSLVAPGHISLHACLSSSVCTLTAVSFTRSYVTLDTSNETVEVATKWG